MKLFMILFGWFLLEIGITSLFCTMGTGASIAVITTIAGMIMYWEGIKYRKQ